MVRNSIAVAVLLVCAGANQAHFVFIVPDAKNPQKAIVVFSDELAADANVSIDKIAGIKLQIRDSAGKDTPLTATKAEHALALELPGKGKRIVFGSLDYGVLQKGDSKPFLLRYHPKAIFGPADGVKVGDKLPLEIVPSIVKDKVRFLVLSRGRPLVDAEVTVMRPADAKDEKVKTDKDGLTPAFEAKGRFGVWIRASEAVAGESDGKKYEEVRNYATLVVDIDQVKGP